MREGVPVRLYVSVAKPACLGVVRHTAEYRGGRGREVIVSIEVARRPQVRCGDTVKPDSVAVGGACPVLVSSRSARILVAGRAASVGRGRPCRGRCRAVACRGGA